MLQAWMTPELVCEITLQPVRRHGVDAARAGRVVQSVVLGGLRLIYILPAGCHRVMMLLWAGPRGMA